MRGLLDLRRRREVARRQAAGAHGPATGPRSTTGADAPDPADRFADAPAAPAMPRELEFAGYTEDCRIFGFIRITAERISDALNETDAYGIDDVLVVALEDGRAVEAKHLDVQRDELLVVRATGPRGDPARRARMRPSPITVQTGPYTIHGYLHAPPGADPVLAIRRRHPMVPLTEAWIEYTAAGTLHRARVGTIIVNHELIDWVRLARDEEIRLPGLPAEVAVDTRAKDMTGYIKTWTD